MLATILAVSIALQGPARHIIAGPLDPMRRAVSAGWHDEMNEPRKWGALEGDNKAKVSRAARGEMTLSLGKVPAGWPYTYQWSGVTRDATVDMARFPVLMARTTAVTGYAHLDIEVLNAKNEKVKGFRSSMVNGPGLCTIDLGKELDPAVYRLRLRLIVGGENGGCSATYSWVRFVSREDAHFLEANPDHQNVTSVSRR